MKREWYWRIHGGKPTTYVPLPQRTFVQLEGDIQWCHDKLAKYGNWPMITNYLAELLVERANRFLRPHKQRRKH